MYVCGYYQYFNMHFFSGKLKSRVRSRNRRIQYAHVFSLILSSLHSIWLPLNYTGTFYNFILAWVSSKQSNTRDGLKALGDIGQGLSVGFMARQSLSWFIQKLREESIFCSNLCSVLGNVKVNTVGLENWTAEVKIITWICLAYLLGKKNEKNYSQI